MRHAVVPEPAVAGTVRLVLAGGSRALVQLDDGTPVTVVREQMCPLVPLERVLVPDMPVVGALDVRAKELHLHLEAPSAAVLDAVFPDGTVTPALVTRTAQLGAELALHPDVRVPISRMDVSSNPKDRLDDLLAVGDVVAARVLRHDDGSLRLRLHDVDDDERVQPALRLLPGGPEWLVLPEPTPADGSEDPDADPPHEAASPVPAAPASPGASRHALQSAQLALDAERAETARLRRELEAAKATSPAEMREVLADLGRALAENRQLSEQLRAVNRALARARRTPQPAGAGTCPRDRRERFPDDESWIRHELYLAWIDRVEPGERGHYPLPRGFLVGPEFAASLEQLDGPRLEKAFRACVDVLTGRAEGMASRGVHPLRTGTSGGAPDVVREDGARCLRCAIENDTASARRLHWWRRRDGGLELSRVVLHDDMRP